MKIETQDSAAVVHQVREEGGFTIESNANAFSILFDKLYSNKNQAVVREIYCNAVDVTTNKVPHITVPTEMNPVFVVRDYGPGLSHEDVMALYTTVFRSTKAGDNSKIGGFGLGSKAPFCYTDGSVRAREEERYHGLPVGYPQRHGTHDGHPHHVLGHEPQGPGHHVLRPPGAFCLPRVQRIRQRHCGWCEVPYPVDRRDSHGTAR
jgi:hypothetical protein